MNKLWRLTNFVQCWKDQRGQDLIEYALAAGFVAVTAGVLFPGIGKSVVTVFSKVSSTMTVAASKG
jgi:pilus assembly protein Flp/PilA